MLPFLLSLSMLGVASQIHNESISLAELVSSSPTILLVEPATPAERSTTVPAGSVAMETTLQRLRVLSVVRAPPGQVAPEQVIEVGMPYLAEHAMMVRLREEQGISRSPIFDRYDDPGELSPTGPWLVLLRPCDLADLNMLCFRAEGATLSPSQLPAVQALVAGE